MELGNMKSLVKELEAQEQTELSDVRFNQDLLGSSHYRRGVESRR